jgi:hypothetical protein
MNEQISPLSIKDLLSEGCYYVIPMYQRNYAWDEAEITQLIQDVIDYVPESQNYYMGSLVVFERMDAGRVVYETIDGQQRLTTLSLLASHLKNTGAADLGWYDMPRIRFESRARSQKTLQAIFSGTCDSDFAAVLARGDTNDALLNGYRLVQKILPRKLAENGVGKEDFARYLFEKVMLMRVSVPPHTDLNHYFEMMNSRGEQLEKHEVLKARLMDALRDDREHERSRHCLSVVWEACANMERYVQMGFSPKQRDALFQRGDWGQLLVSDFSELSDKLWSPSGTASDQSVALTIDDIIGPKGAAAGAASHGERKADEAPERFHSVINFPNFLLHVLRVMTRANVALDDKALISTFEKQLLKADNQVARIKEFVLALLRCKYLFDQYVVKREFTKGKDGWSLKRVKWNAEGDSNDAGRANYVNTFGPEDEGQGGNRRILMLLSAFHVSAPTQGYKYWLNAALIHLYYAESVQETSYQAHMESVAQAFVFERFLASENRAEYFDIIHGRDGHCGLRREHFRHMDTVASGLSYKNVENNFVFNYLDYLLWLKHRSSDDKVRGFEFTFRSSVEHFYPQNPMEGQDRLPPEVVDSFGNLCLISHSKNSRLSNFTPLAKTEYLVNNSMDSIKQYLMIKSGPWDAGAIRSHGMAMMEVLVESLDP